MNLTRVQIFPRLPCFSFINSVINKCQKSCSKMGFFPKNSIHFFFYWFRFTTKNVLWKYQEHSSNYFNFYFLKTRIHQLILSDIKLVKIAFAVFGNKTTQFDFLCGLILASGEGVGSMLLAISDTAPSKLHSSLFSLLLFLRFHSSLKGRAKNKRLPLLNFSLRIVLQVSNFQPHHIPFASWIIRGSSIQN